MKLAKGLLSLAKDIQRSSSDGGRQHSNGGGGTHPHAEVANSSGATTIETLESRVLKFKQVLRHRPVNLTALKRLAFHGIPDRDNLRATVWKLLLRYLPCDQEDWAEVLARQRTQYHVFCDELIVDPTNAKKAKGDGSGGGADVADPLTSGSRASSTMLPEVVRLQGEDVTKDDHPLSLCHGSKWNTYFKDTEIILQVERDVVRTHPDMHFFTGDTPEAELHRQEMKQALFMYAKLNPGLCYIQGMNELIAPLYWLFKNDTDRMAREFAEADAFWCFMELISEFRDHFCQQLDNASTGIRATIRKLMEVLQHHDRELWHHIEVQQKVDPQFYAFRWITLMLSQEFAFPDTLRIWDTILSDPHGRTDCLLRICCAMVLNVRPVLMAGDFAVILKTLQRYPPIDVNVLLQHAASMPPCRVVLGAPV